MFLQNLKIKLFGYKVGDVLRKIKPDYLEEWEPYTCLTVEVLKVGKRSYRVRIPRDIDVHLLVQIDSLASGRDYTDHHILLNLAKDSAHRTFKKIGINPEILINKEANNFLK
jgi:hypothetical protein